MVPARYLGMDSLDRPSLAGVRVPEDDKWRAPGVAPDESAGARRHLSLAKTSAGGKSLIIRR